MASCAAAERGRPAWQSRLVATLLATGTLAELEAYMRALTPNDLLQAVVWAGDEPRPYMRGKRNCEPPLMPMVEARCACEAARRCAHAQPELRERTALPTLS